MSVWNVGRGICLKCELEMFLLPNYPFAELKLFACYVFGRQLEGGQVEIL